MASLKNHSTKFKMDTSNFENLVKEVSKGFHKSLGVSVDVLGSFMGNGSEVTGEEFSIAVYRGVNSLPAGYYYAGKTKKDQPLKFYIASMEKKYLKNPNAVVNAEEEFSGYVEALYEQYVIVVSVL